MKVSSIKDRLSNSHDVDMEIPLKELSAPTTERLVDWEKELQQELQDFTLTHSKTMH
jgi:hypothetical protein